MDYHQKYQKYKFKYLNLLNQFGGGYTDDEFNNLLKNTPDKTPIKGSKCPISQELVLKEDAILIDREIYDASHLFEYILYNYDNKSILPTDVAIIPPIPHLPHNKNRLKPITLFDIYDKVKEKYDYKAKKDFKILILRRIMVDEQIKLIRQREQGQKVKLTDQYIELNAEIDTNNLLIEYKKIFVNKFENDFIISYLKNYRILAFIDDDRITPKIIKYIYKTLPPIIYMRFIPKEIK